MTFFCETHLVNEVQETVLLRYIDRDNPDSNYLLPKEVIQNACVLPVSPSEETSQTKSCNHSPQPTLQSQPLSLGLGLVSISHQFFNCFCDVITKDKLINCHHQDLD